MILRNNELGVQEAVLSVARLAGLKDHLDEAEADVLRALNTLRREGLASSLGTKLQLEYPIAGPWVGGQLISGYIDLVALAGDRLDVVDFKTDVPPRDAMERVYQQYVDQVLTYKQLLMTSRLFVNKRIRCGLLFTAETAVRWVDN
jgi:ATP-dependent exoDNAse (exonuclease V) beta subunit